MRLWRTSARYTPLLPDGGHSVKQAFNNRRFCCNVLLVSSLVVFVLLLGTLRLFDFDFSFVSAPLDVTSSQIPDDRLSVTHSDIPTETQTPTNQNTPAIFPSPAPSPTPSTDYAKEHLTMDEIRTMVSQTKGFFTRDYSLGLGWNNMRYIIEASVLQARLLNRTLILPSFVYARSCAYDITVCADEAHMVNKGEAIGWADWKDLPIEQQMGWQIPITMMLDISQLRRFQPVITTAEYLKYARLPETIETSSGYWDRSAFQQFPDPARIKDDLGSDRPSLYVIENHWYDSDGVTRVDVLTDSMKQRGGWKTGNLSVPQPGSWKPYIREDIQILLDSLLPPDKTIVEWDEARNAVEALSDKAPTYFEQTCTLTPQYCSDSRPDFDNDDFIEDVLNKNGWEVLHTFLGAGGMDFVKHVVIPIRQVVKRTSIRGFVEDYAYINADVVVLAGETHLFRKPGQMRFTTQYAQQLFQRLVLHHVVPPGRVYTLARKLDLRVSAMNNGRQWMASHARRGDFVTVGWAWGGNSTQGHLERVKQHLEEGRKLLQSERPYVLYSIPDVAPDTALPHREPPQKGDRFFIATDERDPENLRHFTENGAVMFRDIVTFEDRREFGWGILFADIIGLVEQATLARASYFYGSAMSSFTGGVFNMRAVLGAEQATGLAD